MILSKRKCDFLMNPDCINIVNKDHTENNILKYRLFFYAPCHSNVFLNYVFEIYFDCIIRKYNF